MPATVDATREFHGALGVWGGYVRQTRFLHNDICRVAYGGLSLGWGWAIDWTATFQRENEIAYNHITHWMGVLDDSGATYTLGPHMNSSLHHNYAGEPLNFYLFPQANPSRIRLLHKC